MSKTLRGLVGQLENQLNEEAKDITVTMGTYNKKNEG